MGLNTMKNLLAELCRSLYRKRIRYKVGEGFLQKEKTESKNENLDRS